MNPAANARDAIENMVGVTFGTGNLAADEIYCAARPNMKPGDDVTLVVADNGNGIAHHGVLVAIKFCHEMHN